MGNGILHNLRISFWWWYCKTFSHEYTDESDCIHWEKNLWTITKLLPRLDYLVELDISSFSSNLQKRGEPYKYLIYHIVSKLTKGI